MNPTIGQLVHYVARGNADSAFPMVCRMAFVTETDEHFSAFKVGLLVCNPTGMFFHPIEMGGAEYGSGDPGVGAPGARCGGGDRAYPPGTWHLPERG